MALIAGLNLIRLKRIGRVYTRESASAIQLLLISPPHHILIFSALLVYMRVLSDDEFVVSSIFMSTRERAEMPRLRWLNTTSGPMSMPVASARWRLPNAGHADGLMPALLSSTHATAPHLLNDWPAFHFAGDVSNECQCQLPLLSAPARCLIDAAIARAILS